eukprot:15367007-Ditylum_brightwellii.AAC.4
MSQCSCSGSRQKQAATEELYATLPKAGAMLTINIKPTCAFEIEMASCQLLFGGHKNKRIHQNKKVVLGSFSFSARSVVVRLIRK